MKRASRKVSDSALETTRLMMPMDGNIQGNVFGGAIMKYMDEIAAIVAFRHAGRPCVTASIDRMNFYRPVYIGNVLIMKAAVNYVGVTSMEVGVRIEAQDLLSGKVTHTGSCYLSYVALDGRGRPVQIATVTPVSSAEKRRYKQAVARRKLREAEVEALRD